jgi:hypothetical protein
VADIVKLLQSHYDEQYGIVNVRPVVDQLLETSRDPFAEVSKTFDTAEPRWRIPILEAMRALAASGHCNEGGAADILRATSTVAADSGVDEYFKSVNAIVSSRQAAGVLTGFVASLLEDTRNEFARRLAFYTVGMLLEHNMGNLTSRLRGALKSAAASERSAQLRRQFGEVIDRL